MDQTPPQKMKDPKKLINSNGSHNCEEQQKTSFKSSKPSITDNESLKTSLVAIGVVPQLVTGSDLLYLADRDQNVKISHKTNKPKLTDPLKLPSAKYEKLDELFLKNYNRSLEKYKIQTKSSNPNTR